jgi:pimeloyl-ACP methyl ester carboxylesterase
VDSIEAWRISSKIKTFVLAGHSFGAYIGACYAKKYPNTISRLILISPPGVKQMDEQMS